MVWLVTWGGVNDVGGGAAGVVLRACTCLEFRLDGVGAGGVGADGAAAAGGLDAARFGV